MRIVRVIKEWLIKKLGGYTKREYESTCKQVEHLRVRFTLSMVDLDDYVLPSGMISEKSVRRELSQKFIPLIENRMVIMRSESMIGEPVFEGCISIVKEVTNGV